ncbi:MAG: MoxR family ATPase [Magnetococcales bacterium]|nr:MoxR family ATPase [Magnetococcales bacterium]NGZ26672.1 MoxR family ATPase [Magnetococcales bacterium]
MAEASNLLDRLCKNLESVIQGKRGALRQVLAAFAGGGHVLLEDVPGTGKTTLAKALAKSTGCDFKRIQFTPDLMPSDITGLSIYHPSNHAFTFRPGPVFCHILLADEINRASPRTQSALLEAMAEGQVSVEGVVHPLQEPFFVIATQNPVEYHGTYPLPEAQLDRFALCLGLGYLSAEEETALLSLQSKTHPLDHLTPCLTLSEVIHIRQAAKEVRVSEAIRHYMVALVRETRQAEGVKLGASPRAALALMKCCQALALVDGMDFVTPEQVQELAVPVLAHRLMLDPQARFAGVTGEKVVAALLQKVLVPR